MILTALEMQGFKSFPDKTVLQFGKGITSVIGPNGSGKSNISDAVRWVFGEQSTKNLRGAKMEDVVFGGTDLRKPLGFAEVTVRLDNTDRSLNHCDRDEVSVTRRYYRSGESEYLLNGEIVRLRDVHELFMDTGLGKDGYSLVSQGRIADLVSSKSSQRREMLEEAAGISHFRYRRTDANRRLAQAEENLVRLRDILSELESRVGPLKIQSEKAQKFLVLAQDKKDLEIGLWLHAIEKSKTGLKEQEHKLALAQSQYETAQTDLDALESEIESLFTAGQDVTLKIEAVRQAAANLEEEAVQIEGRIAVELNTIEHNNQTIERITRDMEDAVGTEQHIDEQIRAAQAEINALIEGVKQKQQDLDAAAEKISGVKSENSSYSEKAAGFSEEIARLSAAASAKRIEISTAVSSRDEVSARIEAIDTAAAARGTLLDELNARRAQCQTELEECNQKTKELLNAVTGYNMRVQSRSGKAEKLKKDLDALNLEVHQKNARVKMLDDLEKNMEGYSGSVKAVMRESKRGTLRGIHGPISQLITVKDEYAVAIETALGPAVQHIVTDNENDAKRAIQYLKDSREGRATFLPLTTIRSRDLSEKGLSQCAGFVDMAHNLLDYDAPYTDIIKSLLARTVVADNMDSAIAMAKKYEQRIRIVTLDGQVINAGGSMTGGSRGQNAGILSRANEIEKLKDTVAVLDKKFAAMQHDYKLLSEDLAAAEADLDGSQADLARAQEEAIRKDSELRVVLERIETAGASMEELEREKTAAGERIAGLGTAIESGRESVRELEEQIDAQQRNLDALKHAREELDTKREELLEEEARINMDILSMRKDMQAKEEAVAALRRRKAAHEGRVGDLNDEIAGIAKESLDIKAGIACMREQVQSLREQSAQSKASVAALVTERGEFEAKNSALRAQERNKTSEKEKLGGELARLEERKSTLEKELEDSRNKLYDEYQLTLREAEDLGIVLEEPSKAARRLAEIRNKIRALGSVNVGAVEEYKEVSERYTFLGGQIRDIEQSREELTRLIEELTGKMAERFREQFAKINSHFGETFAELFDGGKAELVLENRMDVLECNIEIKVQPPGKNVQNIDLLSGGEKGLAAISLLFAILKVTPAPFCIFDEVEAALDENNVVRFAKYVRRMTGNTQFILITHRRGTMEEADILYGVTMQEDGVSKLLELKTTEMAKRLGIA